MRIDCAYRDYLFDMGRARISDASIIVAGGHNNADTLTRCIFDSVLDIIAVVAAQAQVNDLCAMICRVTNSCSNG